MVLLKQTLVIPNPIVLGIFSVVTCLTVVATTTTIIAPTIVATTIINVPVGTFLSLITGGLYCYGMSKGIITLADIQHIPNSPVLSCTIELSGLKTAALTGPPYDYTADFDFGDDFESDTSSSSSGSDRYLTDSESD